MKLYKILIATLAAASLSGCGLYKNYERPANIDATGIYGKSQCGDRSMAELHWRDVFTDPMLQELIEKALVQNSNMRQADLRIQQAQNSLMSAKLAFLPSLGFQPNGAIMGAIDPYNREQYKNQMGNGATKTYSFPLALNWQIDAFGSLRNAKKASEVGVENMKTVRQAVQTALVANVANIYYTLAMMDQQLAISEQTRDIWKKNLEVTKMLMEAGQSNKAAVASTEANYWSICASIEDLKYNIEDIEGELSRILGEKAMPIRRQALSSFQTPSICTTGLPIALLERRPDVKQAELALAAAFYGKNIAKAAFYPAINITADGEFANSLSGVGIINPGGFILSAVASLAQPIFAQGKLRAGYKNAKADMEIAAIGFQQTLLDAGHGVSAAMDAINTAKAKKEFIENQVNSLTQAVDATEKLMKLSNTNYLQVLTAQSSLLQAQLNQVANDFSIVSSTIKLYQELGGGAE